MLGPFGYVKIRLLGDGDGGILVVGSGELSREEDGVGRRFSSVLLPAISPSSMPLPFSCPCIPKLPSAAASAIDSSRASIIWLAVGPWYGVRPATSIFSDDTSRGSSIFLLAFSCSPTLFSIASASESSRAFNIWPAVGPRYAVRVALPSNSPRALLVRAGLDGLSSIIDRGSSSSSVSSLLSSTTPFAWVLFFVFGTFFANRPFVVR